MEIKYLYGKQYFLQDIIDGKASPRFSDISHFSRLENEKIQDNEDNRIFEIDKNNSRIEINGRTISPESLTSNPTLSIPTRHCYCLCMSDAGDDPILYKRFNADVCLEINVDLLLQIIHSAVLPKFPGMEVIARKVSYFSLLDFPPTTDSTELVFYKSDTFRIEREYRVGLFYPLSKSGFKAENGEPIPFKMENESLHFQIHSMENKTLAGLVKRVFRADRHCSQH